MTHGNESVSVLTDRYVVEEETNHLTYDDPLQKAKHTSNWIPRIYTRVLVELPSQKKLDIYNTQLDDRDIERQKAHLNQLKERCKQDIENGIEVLLTGKLNIREGNLTYKDLMFFERDLNLKHVSFVGKTYKKDTRDVPAFHLLYSKGFKSTNYGYLSDNPTNKDEELYAEFEETEHKKMS